MSLVLEPSSLQIFFISAAGSEIPALSFYDRILFYNCVPLRRFCQDKADSSFSISQPRYALSSSRLILVRVLQ